MVSSAYQSNRKCFICCTTIVNKNDLQRHKCRNPTKSKTIWKQKEDGSFMTSMKKFRANLIRRPDRCCLPINGYNIIPSPDNMKEIHNLFVGDTWVIRYEGVYEGHKVIILNL